MDFTMLGKLVATILTIPGEWLGVLYDVAVKLASQRGGEWGAELARFARREPCWVVVATATEKVAKKADEVKVYLKSLFVDLVVGATLGTESIPGLSASGKPTEATKATGFKLVADGTIAEFFGSLGENRLRWTRSQVAQFVTDNPSKLRGGGYGNFFELEDGSVALVYVLGGQPYAHVCKFSYGDIWDARCEHLVFAPHQ